MDSWNLIQFPYLLHEIAVGSFLYNTCAEFFPLCLVFRTIFEDAKHLLIIPLTQSIELVIYPESRLS